jgi:hypothetical protein
VANAVDNIDTEDPMAIIYHLWMKVLLCSYQFTAKIVVELAQNGCMDDGTDDILRCLPPDYPELSYLDGICIGMSVPTLAEQNSQRANANPHKHLLVGNVRGWGRRGSLTSNLAAVPLVRPPSRGVL